jgi:DNA invertase Pin-like site-specific DNA recombinase
MPENPVKSAIVYARFSTPSQERGDSLDRQLTDCREFCQRHNLNVVDEITDLGRSAYKGDHLSIGNLGKLSERIMAGEVANGTVLVVEKMDRLSRQKPRIVQRWIEDLTDRGICIAVRDPERWIDAKYLDEGSNTVALLDILMNSHAANIFSENLSKRVGRAWSVKKTRARENGERLSRMIPAWLYVDEQSDDILVNSERGDLVRRMFEMTAEGVGAWSIATTFNKEGIEPWGYERAQRAAKVRGWNSTYIRQVIKHPAVEGVHAFTVPKGKRRVPSSDVVRGYYPMIEGLDAELIARARGFVQNRGHRSGGRFAPYARNIFSEIALCAECGSTMTLTGRGVHSDLPAYLQCSSAKKRKGCGNRTCFNYKHLEKAVLGKVLAVALNDRFFRSDDGHIMDLRRQVAECEKDLADAEAARQGYSKLLARRPDDDRLNEDYDRARDACHRIEVQLEDVRRKLTRARGAVDPAEHAMRVMQVMKAMQSNDEEELKTARRRVHASLKEMVSRMECKATAIEGRRKPERTVSIALVNGLIFYTFDNDGNVLVDLDMSEKQDFVTAIRAEAPEMVDDMLRRKSSMSDL